ncbi:MAG TPA: heparinase II/III family protein [Bryobacteraceae bacterium]|nr:heparinase II/III family protein [Bryobacteraceae bacterium]HOL70411.1 heparinase II/III family protein [Bryobacteraceae bacterium]HOQ46607.1 heparinase II/III family protein [Bryobacteraceae bacterium]HPQ14259.1 heparinase II/III family protein [Bryobacteraceae bacterium]HPU73960.1 heparinase II/III family protein [Bryobacteraceae bacterium]
MPQLSRRTFVAGSASLPAAIAAAPQTAGKRNLITSSWSQEKLSAVLPPPGRFRPFPTASERGPWEALPQDARAALLEAGERQLKTPWEVLPATVFLEFQRNGNRSRYEGLRNRRRNKLQALVIAECIEGKGRFLDEIANGVWLTCEESFWGVPAHLGVQKAGVGLPDVTEPIVDLFAAETASLLAWTDYLVGPQLAGVSKLIPERIRLEIDRRMLEPCLDRSFWWMGLGGENVNNWTPWICSNWLVCAFLMERDPSRLQAAGYKILRCLDSFLNVYHDDGGCDEGPSYWGRAGASLFDCLELLREATGGAFDLFQAPLVKEIGRYILRAHIYDDWYTNFADAPARVSVNGDLVYRFGKRIGDEAMMAHGAFSAFRRDERAIPGDSISRQLPALFNLEELRKAPRTQAQLRDVWLPGVQVIAARLQEGSSKGLYLAAKGGHNAESHNHNDVGNFIVFSDGRPAIIDVGVETYTAQTFSSRRYEIWTMQSAYHNCPTIDGVMQAPGRRFAARDVSYRSDDSAAEFRLDIAGAYPPEARLESWLRTFRFDRAKNQIELTDEYVLRQAAKEITLTFMTPCRVETGAGKLTLTTASGNTVSIFYDGGVFKPDIEEIPLKDARLRSTWGDRLFRILLRAANPGLRGRWNTRITGS